MVISNWPALVIPPYPLRPRPETLYSRQSCGYYLTNLMEEDNNVLFCGDSLHQLCAKANEITERLACKEALGEYFTKIPMQARKNI